LFVPEDPDNISSCETNTAQISKGSNEYTYTQAVHPNVSRGAREMGIPPRKHPRVEDDNVLNYEYELKRIELEERRIAVDERKIALQERRTALEHSNAMRAVELSDKLREADHNIAMRSTELLDKKREADNNIVMRQLSKSAKEKQITNEEVEFKIKMAKLKELYEN